MASVLTGTLYITAAQFRVMCEGLDLTGITDDQLDDYIRMAGTMADTYCNTTFDVKTRTERQTWRDTRRFYPDDPPVNAVKEFIIHVGAGQRARIGVSSLFVNNHAGYMEVVSLALAVPLVAELVSLGLVEVVAEATYKCGYGAYADSVETIVTDIGSDAPAVFDVSDGAEFAVDEVIRIDDELFWITSIVADTVTAIRDVATNGNHLALHSTGTTIFKLVLALPEDVKIAVAMIVGCMIAAKLQREQGAMGIRSFLIGSYSVAFAHAGWPGDKSGLSDGAGYPFVPDIARLILDSYTHIALR